MMKTRHCHKCNKDKKLQDFAVDKSNKLGRAYRCKFCCNKIRRIWRQHPDNKKKAQNYNLLKKYGITVEQQEAMLKAQKGKCAVCGTRQPGGKYDKWQTDHKHAKKGKVRGLLCYACNSALGLLKDSVKVLQKAILYLERHENNRAVIRNNRSV